MKVIVTLIVGWVVGYLITRIFALTNGKAGSFFSAVDKWLTNVVPLLKQKQSELECELETFKEKTKKQMEEDKKKLDEQIKELKAQVDEWKKKAGK